MTRKRTKTNLKPINNTPHEEMSVENNETTNAIVTQPITDDEDMSLDDYMKLANKDNILDEIETETDIEKYTSEIEELKAELHKYKSENVNLKNDLGRIKSNMSNATTNSENEEKIKNLEEENDNLILRNSELEYENARLTQTVKLLQEEKDKKLHTYTPNGYTPNGCTINNQPQGFKPRIGPTYRKLDNGYEDWI
jgi:chromosome segregation ATPase